MSGAALAIFAVSAAISTVQGIQASQAQKRQNRIANRLAAIKRARDIRLAIGRRRVQVANVEAAGVALNVQGGTAVEGASSSITSSTAGIISAANQQITGQRTLADISNEISTFQQQSIFAGGLASLATPFIGGTGSVGAQNRTAVADFFSFT